MATHFVFKNLFKSGYSKLNTQVAYTGLAKTQCHTQA